MPTHKLATQRIINHAREPASLAIVRVSEREGRELPSHRLSTSVGLAAALALAAVKGLAAEQPRSAVLDLSIPFAAGATVLQADASTPLFWGRFQNGRVAGRNFRIFPDASASFGSGTTLYGDRIDVVCDMPAHRCGLRDPEGREQVVVADEIHLIDASAPESSSLEIARAYASWVLAGQRVPQRKPPIAAAGLEASSAEVPAAALEPGRPSGPAQPTETPVSSAGTTTPSKAASHRPVSRSFHQEKRSERPGAKRERVRRGSVEQQMKDVAARQETPAETFFKRLKPDCVLSTGVAISYQDESSDSTKHGKLQTALTCAVTPVPRLRISASVLLYPISGQQQPDDSDYNYSIAYRFTDDLSLTYASYSGNRWTKQPGEKNSGGLTGGTFTLSHRLPIKIPAFEQPESIVRGFNCSGSVSYAPRYGTDGQGQRRNKTSLGLSCGFTLLDRLQLRASTHFYPISDQQQPWDPDFTYSASYRFTDRLTLEYANYSGNRWPWNDAKGNARGLASGGFRLAYKLDF